MAKPKLIIPPDKWAAILAGHRAGDTPGTLAKRWGYNANTIKARLRQAGSRRGADHGEAGRQVIDNAGDSTLLSKDIREEDGIDLLTPVSTEVSSQLDSGESGQEKTALEEQHVQEQERQRVTLLRKHRKQANKMRSLLEESMREAKANPLSVRDLDTLTRVHERLIKTDRLIFELEDSGSEGSNTLINRGVIVIPAKVGGDVEAWADAVATTIKTPAKHEGKH